MKIINDIINNCKDAREINQYKNTIKFKLGFKKKLKMLDGSGVKKEKTLSFSKKVENYIGAIWYFIHDYNANLAGKPLHI